MSEIAKDGVETPRSQRRAKRGAKALERVRRVKQGSYATRLEGIPVADEPPSLLTGPTGFAASVAGTRPPGTTAETEFDVVLSLRASPSFAIAAHVARGLPVDALAGLDVVLPNIGNRIIPRSTLAAQKKKSDTLTLAQSERVYQVGKVLGFAVSVLGGEERARAFLSRPHPMLHDRTPLDVALESGAGADLVVNILGRGAYGGGA